jgi:hypothetical protein
MSPVHAPDSIQPIVAIAQLEVLANRAESLDGSAHRAARLLCATLMQSSALAIDDTHHVTSIEAYFDALFTARRHEAFGGAARVRERIVAECAALRACMQPGVPTGRGRGTTT